MKVSGEIMTWDCKKQKKAKSIFVYKRKTTN